MDGVNDMLHFIHMQPVLNRIAPVVRSGLFRSKYGDIGQKFTADYLDTMAKQGGMGEFARLKGIDELRQAYSIWSLWGRIPSAVKHMGLWAMAAERVGPLWFARGMEAANTPAGQAILSKYAPETFLRSGGEPAQAELRGKVAQAGFIIQRTGDRWGSQAAVMGAYLRALHEQGNNWEAWDKTPVDRMNIARSLALARRAVASPLYKDKPQMLSRGKGLGGSVTAARTIGQFSNIPLDIASYLYNEGVSGGIGRMAKGIKTLNMGDTLGGAAQAARVGLALAVGTAISSGLASGSKDLEHMLLNYKAKNPKGWMDEFAHEMMRTTVPVIGPTIEGLWRGRTGMALSDMAGDAIRGSVNTFAAKTDAARQSAAFTAANGIPPMLMAGARLMGLPMLPIGGGYPLQLLREYQQGQQPPTSGSKGGSFKTMGSFNRQRRR